MKMKNLLLTLVTMIALPAFAGAKAPQVSPEETIRKAIDNICGDTWCEGDYRYSFASVTLDAKANQFTVDFTMTPYLDDETVLDDEDVSAIVKPGASVQCIVKGYSDASVIVGSFGQLNDKVYDALSKCVNTLEDKLAK